MIYFFLIGFILEVAAGFYDAKYSEAAFRKGYVEGNDWITWFAKSERPKFYQLVEFNLVQSTVLSLGCFFGAVFNQNPLIFLSGVCLSTNAVKHFLKGRKARKLAR